MAIGVCNGYVAAKVLLARTATETMQEVQREPVLPVAVQIPPYLLYLRPATPGEFLCRVPYPHEVPPAGQGSVPKTATPGTPETGSWSATLKGREEHRTSHLRYPIDSVIYSCDHQIIEEYN